MRVMKILCMKPILSVVYQHFISSKFVSASDYQDLASALIAKEGEFDEIKKGKEFKALAFEFKFKYF